jgi:opacity protein-like surface antigen
MIRSFSCTFILLSTIITTAQDNNWSIEVSYPISINDAFTSSNQGTIGAGMKYRFADLGKLRLGVSADVTWFTTTIVNDSDPVQEFKYRDVFFQPRLFVEGPLSRNGRLRFSGGIGWTWLNSRGGSAFFDEFGRIQGGEDWALGLNLNIGLIYDITPSIYVQTQYDQIFLSGDASDGNIGLIKLGGGFRF